MKDIIDWKALYVISIAFILIIIIIMLPDNSPEESPTPEPSPVPEYSYLKESFMDSCVLEEDDALEPYCDCAYEYLIREYGAGRLVEIELNMDENDDKLPEEIENAAIACTKELI